MVVKRSSVPGTANGPLIRCGWVTRVDVPRGRGASTCMRECGRLRWLVLEHGDARLVIAVSRKGAWTAVTKLDPRHIDRAMFGLWLAPPHLGA